MSLNKLGHVNRSFVEYVSQGYIERYCLNQTKNKQINNRHTINIDRINLGKENKGRHCWGSGLCGKGKDWWPRVSKAHSSILRTEKLGVLAHAWNLESQHSAVERGGAEDFPQQHSM